MRAPGPGYRAARDGSKARRSGLQRARSPRPAAALCAVFVAACRYGYDPIPLGDDGGASPDAPVVDVVLPDANVPDDASPPDVSCDPTALLADDFTSEDPRWAPFDQGGAVPAIVNGRLRVTLSPSSATRVYGGYVSAGSYDLIGRRLRVEVPSMVDTSGHAQALLQLKHTAGGVTEELGFEQQHGALRMYSSGAPGDLTIPYDPVQQRYWQVREDSGVVFFETSPDGVAWTLRFSTDSTFDLSQVRIVLDAGRFQQELALGYAEFDDLGGTIALGSACKAASAR